MDGRKGCFTSGCTGGAYDKTIINQIMLRYRPIAPKPVVGGSLAGEPSQEGKKPSLTNGRAKRKYVRIRKRRCKREKVVKPREDKRERSEKTVMTLQLLPEITKAEKEAPTRGSRRNIDLTVPIWLTIDNPVNRDNILPRSVSDRTVSAPCARVVESWVTVECVTDTYTDGGGGMGSTDVERIKSLEMDACPGFVSDGLNRVKWVNQAYRRMVGPQGGSEPPSTEMVVRLVVKEELPVVSRAFACRVRVEYTWQKQRSSQTVPCDVWRIDFVGLAWRLDVESALSLGRR